jgi:hypothetical protein
VPESSHLCLQVVDPRPLPTRLSKADEADRWARPLLTFGRRPEGMEIMAEIGEVGRAGWHARALLGPLLCRGMWNVTGRFQTRLAAATRVAAGRCGGDGPDPSRRGQVFGKMLGRAGPGPSRGAQAPLAFSAVNRFCMERLYGCVGRLTAENGGFRPGQPLRRRNSRRRLSGCRRRCSPLRHQSGP